VGFAFQVDLHFPLGVMGSAASNYKEHKEPVSREGDLYQQPGGWNHANISLCEINLSELRYCIRIILTDVSPILRLSLKPKVTLQRKK